MIRRTCSFAPLLAVLVLCGCTGGSPEILAPPPTLMTAEAIPSGGLWIDLDGTAEHQRPTGHASKLLRGSWVPVVSVVDEGSTVKPGDELARYDTAALRMWNARDANFIKQQELSRRLDLLRADGEVTQLESAMNRLRAQRRVLAATLTAASTVDQDLIRVAELQVQNAESAHAADATRLERLTKAAAAGAPISGEDLAKAREDEIWTRAAMVTPRVALALARQPADAATVIRLQLALADVDAQLGSSPEEGLAADVRSAKERRKRREIDTGNPRGAWRKRNYENRESVLADPTIRATVEGVVQLRNSSVRVGQKLNGGLNTIFVLDHGGLAARIQIPEQLRALVEVGSPVILQVPGESGAVISGQVRSLAAAPERGRTGHPQFPALVELEHVPDAVKPGMEADCRIAVAVRGKPSVLPSFCIPDPDRPSVILSDGTTRTIQGYRASAWFVILEGLRPGEQVRIPSGKTASTRVRLSTLVEPAVFTPVQLHSAGWEPIELLPEGSAVTTGMRIARMSSADSWRMADDVRADANMTMIQARYDLAVAQFSAGAERAAAQAAAVRASIARSRARLDARVLREEYDAVARARSAETVTRAEIALGRATRDLAATIEERRVGAASEQALRDARFAVTKSEIAMDRARLNTVADELAVDWLSLRKAESAAKNAEEAEVTQRSRILIAGEAYRAQLASALARFDKTRHQVEQSLKEIGDDEVFAPVDGVLVYGRDGDGQPKVGRILQTNEPFRIATRNERRATFEVPARLFGTIHQGDQIRLSTPGRDVPIIGVIHAVAVAFLPPQSLAEEIAIGRTVGPEDRVFKVTVAFSDLPLGSTVSVEF